MTPADRPSAQGVPLRLLIDPPESGVVNMARDEALVDAVVADAGPATLRFYRWAAPTISLGYFQPYADAVGFAESAPIVRRTTGGGAILHDRELTYALAVRSGHPLLASGPTRLYCLMHDAIVAVMRSLEIRAERRGPVTHGSAGREASSQPFFCFARAHALDVVVDGRKLAGSAQRRVPDGVLQHGSIVLEAASSHQPSAAVWDTCRVDPDDLARRIAERFAADNDLPIEEGEWRGEELARASRNANRYNDASWTQRR